MGHSLVTDKRLYHLRLSPKDISYKLGLIQCVVRQGRNLLEKCDLLDKELDALPLKHNDLGATDTRTELLTVGKQRQASLQCHGHVLLNFS